MNGYMQRRRRGGLGFSLADRAVIPPPEMTPLAVGALSLQNQAGARNYRNFPPGADPRAFSADVFAQDQVRQRFHQGVVPIADVLDDLDAHNRPPQLVQATYVASITAAGKPVLLVPKNPRRQSLLVSNSVYSPALPATGQVIVSFDAPMKLGANYAGIVVPSGGTFAESNGSVSINDIWVASNDVNGVYPFFVIAYEGTLSIAGNKP